MVKSNTSKGYLQSYFQSSFFTSKKNVGKDVETDEVQTKSPVKTKFFGRKQSAPTLEPPDRLASTDFKPLPRKHSAGHILLADNPRQARAGQFWDDRPVQTRTSSMHSKPNTPSHPARKVSVDIRSSFDSMRTLDSALRGNKPDSKAKDTKLELPSLDSPSGPSVHKTKRSASVDVGHLSLANPNGEVPTSQPMPLPISTMSPKPKRLNMLLSDGCSSPSSGSINGRQSPGNMCGRDSGPNSPYSDSAVSSSVSSLPSLFPIKGSMSHGGSPAGSPMGSQSKKGGVFSSQQFTKSKSSHANLSSAAGESGGSPLSGAPQEVERSRTRFSLDSKYGASQARQEDSSSPFTSSSSSQPRQLKSRGPSPGSEGGGVGHHARGSAHRSVESTPQNSSSDPSRPLTVREKKEMKTKADQLKELKSCREYYDDLVDLTKNSNHTVTMDVLEKEMLENWNISLPSGVTCLLSQLRKEVLDENNIEFQTFLLMYFPEKSIAEIERMIQETGCRDIILGRQRKILEDEVDAPRESAVLDLNRMWNLWDLDGSGELDKHEFREVLRELGVDTREDFDRMYNQIDKSGNGTIDKTEFMAWWVYGDSKHKGLFVPKDGSSHAM